MALAGELTNPALSVPATGKFAFGVEYFFSNGDFKPSSPGFGKISADSEQIYARGAYSAFDGNEVFVKLGGADFVTRRAFEDNSAFEPGFDTSVAAGVKQSFEVMPNIRIGGILQYAYFSDYAWSKTMNVTSGNVTQDLKAASPWQADAALAATYVGDGWAPYIGPMMSWRRFDWHDVRSGAETSNRSTTYSESELAGGFIGLDFWRGSMKGTLEVQFSSEESAGLTFSYLFP